MVPKLFSLVTKDIDWLDHVSDHAKKTAHGQGI